MKKLLFTLTMAICASLFSSCDSIVNNAIQKVLEQSRKELPIQIDEGLVVDDITLGDNGIVYHVTVNEELYDMGLLKENAPEIKKGIIDDLDKSVGDDNEVKEFLKAAVELNKPVNYKYEGDTSGDIVRVKISTAEIKAILANKD